MVLLIKLFDIAVKYTETVEEEFIRKYLKNDFWIFLYIVDSDGASNMMVWFKLLKPPWIS